MDVPSNTINKTGESFTEDDMIMNDGGNTNTINENEDLEFEDEFFDGDDIDLQDEETAKEVVAILNENDTIR